jgi:hypothetical protein
VAGAPTNASGPAVGGSAAVLAAPAPQAPAGPPPPPLGPPAAAGAARAAARREQLERLRRAATTEPGRLRIIGAGLVALVLLFGALTAWQISERSSAARNVVERSQPLTTDAADIYRYLADADATSADGFLAGGQEPKATRDRYDRDIDRAGTLLARAAANTHGSSTGQVQISRLNRELPRYTGLVETARTNNRQGLPLGGAYLRYASERMRTVLLPAAEKLYDVENARLRGDYGDARAFPWASIALGIVALGGLVWAQRRLYHRTNRVFNVGLVATSAATAVVLLWLVVGHSVARAQLGDSYDHGAKSLKWLNDARITALNARGDENLTLVSRGSGYAYETKYRSEMKTLHGDDDGRPTGLLDLALLLADDDAGRAPVRAATDSLGTWQKLHKQERASDDGGDYDTAVAQVIGGKDAAGKPVTRYTGKAFDAMDTDLSRAVVHEQEEFEEAARDGREAFSGIAVGAVLLAVAAGAGVVLGIGRRLSEYR